MPRPPLVSTLALLLTVAVIPAAPAAELVARLDAETSEISFVLDATAHRVEGGFEPVGGEVRFDPATGVASGEIVVDATSGDSGNERRDRDMHRKVLESERHPRIVFRVERIAGIGPDLAPGDATAGNGGGGPSEMELEGTMVIHGSEHPVTIPADVRVEGDRWEATATFTVPYVEWGMEDPSFLFLRVGKEVEVTVRAEGVLEPVARSGETG